MKNKRTAQFAFFRSKVLIGPLICMAASSSILSRTLLAFIPTVGAIEGSQRNLTFAERVAYQRVIEDVYWRHRIWPKDY